MVSRFELLASEATLPGTNMSVVQEVGSRQGIRERFATQRAYTDIFNWILCYKRLCILDYFKNG